MSLAVEEKKQIINEYQQSEQDTGSVEVQVALLSKDIAKLTEHLKVNKKDFHTRKGLMNKVNQRRKLLKYIKNRDVSRYRSLIERLGLREI